MSSDIVKKFNKIIKSLLAQLEPYTKKSYDFKFSMMVKFDSSSAIEKFLVHALPLRDKIMTRDESFFYSRESYIDKVDDDDDIAEIMNLQNVYTNLNEESRNSLWEMFQAMLFLGEEYIRMNEKRYVTKT